MQILECHFIKRWWKFREEIHGSKKFRVKKVWKKLKRHSHLSLKIRRNIRISITTENTERSPIFFKSFSLDSQLSLSSWRWKTFSLDFRTLLLYLFCLQMLLPMVELCKKIYWEYHWIKDVVSDNCYTPDNVLGVCVHINSCRSLYDLLRRKPARNQDREFLRNSRCSSGKAMVCCPPAQLPVPGLSECGKTFLQFPNRIFGGSDTKIGEFPWLAGQTCFSVIFWHIFFRMAVLLYEKSMPCDL